MSDERPIGEIMDAALRKSAKKVGTCVPDDLLKAMEEVCEAAANCISDDRYIDEGGTERGGVMFRGRTGEALGNALRRLTAAREVKP